MRSLAQVFANPRKASRQSRPTSLRGPVQVGERIELMHEAFSVNPAQGVATNIELTRAVADDDGLRQEAVCLDAAPRAPSVASRTGS